MQLELEKIDNIDKVLIEHSLSQDDYIHIKQILNREPNRLELGIFSAMWSEHCSYKSSKKYLKGFPTKASWVIQGPGENAGVIDIGDGIAAVFKMESHNHPSFIEPYQGAATGVGGILRDVFTMGARPVANMNSIRFADISRDDEVGKKHRFLLKGVVEGIGGYGNCMGVPTIGGETTFEDCYEGNILVNAFTLGIAKSDEIFLGIAKGVGNPVMYVGSKSGRDGLGGAVMSSNAFDDDTESMRPTVQVGDPFTQKLLLEACLEMFKEDLIVGIQDMGAAGLTSSSFEMAGRSGSGMRMDLDRVPAREDGMSPYDFMLSESQERMLICAKAGKEQRIIEIFEKWDLDVAIIGEVTDTGNMELYWYNEKVADIPIDPVSEEAPELDRPTAYPKYLDKINTVSINDYPTPTTQEAYDRLISHIEVVDKSYVYNQYDSMVQTNTIHGPGCGDASVIRVKENGKALAMSSDCNTRYCYIDPKYGAAAAVMESGRNVAMSGARPLAITDCLNYGNPENPEVMWQFKEGTDGIKEACSSLNTPVIGGNVSLYNETKGVSVYPTPSIAMVGVMDSPEMVIASSFQNEGNSIYLVGDTEADFGGSLYLKEIGGVVGGKLGKVEMSKELILWDLVIDANKQNLIASSKDCSVGGIAIALSKLCAYSEFGCDVNTGFDDEKLIFSESLSRAILEIKDDKAFEKFASTYNIDIKKIGTVKSNIIKIDRVNINLDKFKDIYFGTFKNIIEQL